MSETILRVLASELAVLRVTCGHCKAVVEVASEAVAFGSAFRSTDKCPLCNTKWHRPAVDAMRSLVQSLEELRKDDCGSSLEFVVKPPATK